MPRKEFASGAAAVERLRAPPKARRLDHQEMPIAEYRRLTQPRADPARLGLRAPRAWTAAGAIRTEEERSRPLRAPTAAFPRERRFLSRVVASAGYSPRNASPERRGPARRSRRG